MPLPWRAGGIGKSSEPNSLNLKLVERQSDLKNWLVVCGGSHWRHCRGKVVPLLEYPDEFIAFIQQPSLNAFLGGLTIYGGLIVGGIAVYVFARRNNMNFLRLADATSPGLLLAYGIGRMGCQISGDGDWGIPNPFPKPGWLSWAPDWVWAYAYPNNVNAVYGPDRQGTPAS